MHVLCVYVCIYRLCGCAVSVCINMCVCEYIYIYIYMYIYVISDSQGKLISSSTSAQSINNLDSKISALEFKDAGHDLA